VKEILHKAFWEILRTELESDPPQFKQVCTVGTFLQNRLMTAVPQAVLRIRDPGSGAFLTPGSGIGYFRIPDRKPIFFRA
jgi:hypothetical protein